MYIKATPSSTPARSARRKMLGAQPHTASRRARKGTPSATAFRIPLVSAPVAARTRCRRARGRCARVGRARDVRRRWSTGRPVAGEQIHFSSRPLVSDAHFRRATTLPTPRLGPGDSPRGPTFGNETIANSIMRDSDSVDGCATDARFRAGGMKANVEWVLN